jgi:hypothetical protein
MICGLVTLLTVEVEFHLLQPASASPTLDWRHAAPRLYECFASRRSRTTLSPFSAMQGLSFENRNVIQAKAKGRDASLLFLSVEVS